MNSTLDRPRGPATPCRAHYRTPTLTILGDVRHLTEAGSTPGGEYGGSKPSNCMRDNNVQFNTPMC